MFRSPPIKVTVHFDYDDTASQSAMAASDIPSDATNNYSTTFKSPKDSNVVVGNFGNIAGNAGSNVALSSKLLTTSSTPNIAQDSIRDEFEEYRRRANSGGILPYLPYIPPSVSVEPEEERPPTPTPEPSKEEDKAPKPTPSMLNVPLLGPPPAGVAGVDKIRSHSVGIPGQEHKQMDTLNITDGTEDWEVGNMRRRVCSMPSYYRPGDHPANPDDLRRVRSFSITRKGVVCEGDLYVSAACPISDVIGSNHSSRASSCGILSTGNCTSPASSEESDIIFHYNAVLIGAPHVGKSALIQQFIALEHEGTINASFDDEAEKTVSILLDGEESTMEFIDVSDQEVECYLSSNQADAYVVVYSVEDRMSFEGAIDRLYEIRKDDQRMIAVILVANKTDLVRSRVVQEEEGRSAAKTYDCKYIEVSAAIEHKVNDLLVGILKQIRLIKAKTEKSHARYGRHRVKLDADSCCLIKARQNVLGKLLKTKFSSKSCDNLYVL